MPALLTYAWVIFIFSAAVYALRFKRRVQPYANANRSLTIGYNNIITARLILVIVPWLVIGAGTLSGITKNPIDFLYPRMLNPVVLIFYCIILLEALFVTWWVFFNDGARYLKKHPGIMRLRKHGMMTDHESSTEIKKVFFLGLVVFGIIFILIWLLPIPAIHF